MAEVFRARGVGPDRVLVGVGSTKGSAKPTTEERAGGEEKLVGPSNEGARGW